MLSSIRFKLIMAKPARCPVPMIFPDIKAGCLSLEIAAFLPLIVLPSWARVISFALICRVRKALRLGLMALLLLGALVYLVHVLSSGHAEALDVVRQIDPWRIGISVAPFVVMCLFKAAYHWLLLRGLGTRDESVWTVVDAYCQAQIVRYLPGKIWGLVFQATRLGGRVSAKSVVLANLIQFLNTQLFALWVCAGILLTYVTNNLGWLALIPAGVGLSGVLHRTAIVEKLGVALAARLKTSGPLQPHIAKTGQALPAIALLSLDWLAFFIGWAWICDPQLTLWTKIAMGACYCMAALIATLAIVVPSGLAVREALFVSVGARLDFDVQHLLVYGLVARLILTGSEIATALLASLLRRGSLRRIQ